MPIKIESHIPIPPKATNRKGLLKAMQNMEIGDSFLYDEEKRSSVTGTACQLGIKVATRKVSYKKIRVWRV